MPAIPPQATAAPPLSDDAVVASDSSRPGRRETAAPKSILIVAAHWETRRWPSARRRPCRWSTTSVASPDTTTPVSYPAPAPPQLASDVAQVSAPRRHTVSSVPTGAWTPARYVPRSRCNPDGRRAGPSDLANCRRSPAASAAHRRSCPACATRACCSCAAAFFTHTCARSPDNTVIAVMFRVRRLGQGGRWLRRDPLGRAAAGVREQGSGRAAGPTRARAFCSCCS